MLQPRINIKIFQILSHTLFFRSYTLIMASPSCRPNIGPNKNMSTGEDNSLVAKSSCLLSLGTIWNQQTHDTNTIRYTTNCRLFCYIE